MDPEEHKKHGIKWLEKNLFVWEILKLLLKEFHFIKHAPPNFQRLYTVCHASTPWRHRAVTMATSELRNSQKFYQAPQQNVVPMTSFWHQCDAIVARMIDLWRHLSRSMADGVCVLRQFFNDIRICYFFKAPPIFQWHQNLLFFKHKI